MLIRVITVIRSVAPKLEHLNRAPGKEVHGGDKTCYCYLRLREELQLWAGVEILGNRINRKNATRILHYNITIFLLFSYANFFSPEKHAKTTEASS
jgi:hypothetical protein